MKDKKNMAMIIIVGIVIVLFLCVNTTAFATTGTVVGDNLRLREEESSTSKILDLLDENEKVEILSQNGDWYKVKARGKVGYVNKQFIKVKDGEVVNTTNETPKNEENKVDNNQETPANEQKPVEAPVTTTEPEVTKPVVEEAKNVKVTSDVELRVTPLINGIIINTAKADETYDVISKVGLWSYVKSGNKAGWILTEKTVAVNTEVNKPINETKPEENKPAEIKPEEAKPAEAKPEEVKPAETKPEENKPAETKPEEAKPVEAPAEKMYSKSKTYYVKGTAVNVRSGASKTSEVVKVLNTNTSVEVVGEVDTWYIVKLSSGKAYISKSLLSTEKVEVTSRSSNSITQNNQTTTQQTQPAATQTTTEQKATPATTTKTEQKTTQPATTVASNPSGAAIVEYAKKFLGYRYVYGTNGPNTFDCSGFVQYVYKHFGYSLSRSSSTQANDGVAVSKSNLQPGDVLIFRDTTNTRIGHVGIYIGGGQFIHASNSKTGVIISSLSTSAYQKRYVGARRILK